MIVRRSPTAASCTWYRCETLFGVIDAKVIRLSPHGPEDGAHVVVGLDGHPVEEYWPEEHGRPAHLPELELIAAAVDAYIGRHLGPTQEPASVAVARPTLWDRLLSD